MSDIQKFRELLLDAEIAFTQAIGIAQKSKDEYTIERIISDFILIPTQRRLTDAIASIDKRSREVSEAYTEGFEQAGGDVFNPKDRGE